MPGRLLRWHEHERPGSRAGGGWMVAMLADYPAGDLRFEGLAADGASAADAARLLAAALGRWTAAHRAVRVLQLDLPPPVAGGSRGQPGFEAVALVTYVEPSLDVSPAEAVAAAVVEIHEAQLEQSPEGSLERSPGATAKPPPEGSLERSPGQLTPLGVVRNTAKPPDEVSATEPS